MSSQFESIYKEALLHVEDLWSQVVQPFVFEHPIATFFIAYFSYVAWMLFYRCCLEGQKYVAPPTPKGWDEHKKDVARVREQFNHFLKNRAPGQMVSLNRSRGGHNDSNRTIGADYKTKALKVDVSRLDGVIDIDPKNMLLHIEPGLPQVCNLFILPNMLHSFHDCEPVVHNFPCIRMNSIFISLIFAKLVPSLSSGFSIG